MTEEEKDKLLRDVADFVDDEVVAGVCRLAVRARLD